MGTEVLGNLPFQNQLEMGGMICGHLRQPAMRCLGKGWAGARWETRDDGGGQGREWFRMTKGRVWSEGGNKVRVPAF